LVKPPGRIKTLLTNTDLTGRLFRLIFWESRKSGNTPVNQQAYGDFFGRKALRLGKKVPISQKKVRGDFGSCLASEGKTIVERRMADSEGKLNC